jgi:hypothetical protein
VNASITNPLKGRRTGCTTEKQRSSSVINQSKPLSL